MKNSTAGTYGKILLYLVVAVITLALILSAVLKTYLTTPRAAAQISRMLSDALGQPVVIASVDVSGGAVHLKGVSLANPAGFPLSKLLVVESITIEPEWLKLLSPKRIFERITVQGITVDLRRNGAGVWNFDQLRHRFSSAKPATAEMFIRRLTLAQGTLQVNDQRISGLSLNIANVATKGSENSRVTLEFDGPGHNHYALSGKARLGTDPELEMVLSSAAISLKSLPELLKVKSGYWPEQGTASLRLSAELRRGGLRCGGDVRFKAAVAPGVTRGGSFSGTLSLAAGYDVQKDHLTVENLTLHLDRLLALRATGSVRELKRARVFVIDAGMDAIDIGHIAALIPELKRRKIAIGGTLEKSSLHLSGNAVDGIVVARGKLGLSHGLLRQDTRLIFNDLAVTAAVSGAGHSVTVAGKAAQTRSSGDPVLETLDASFNVMLDRHFNLLTAQSPALSARVRGITFAGGLSYGDGIGRIEHATVKGKDLSVSLGRLTARLPVKKVSSEAVRYPVHADFSGCDIRRGDALLTKLSGTMRGVYAVAPHEQWLEGTAELRADTMAWQGKASGVTTAHAEFSRSGGTADFTVALLGGSVAGKVAFNPFALPEKVGFTINAKGIHVADVQKYAGLRGSTTLSGGVLDAGCAGHYSRTAGLSCRFDALGKNISVTGKAGKTLISAGGIKIAGDLSGQKLVIGEALLTVGKDVAVKADGTLENVFRPDRQGRLAVTVPRTAVGAVLDSFLNVVPRALQEATVEGSLAAEGVVNLREGAVLLDGAVTLTNIGIDAPTEKIKVSGINGVLPLSLDLAGKTAVTIPVSPAFTRKNYDSLVAQLRRTTEKAAAITIGRSSFGGIGVDSTIIHLRAARGVTEIMALDSSLYDGTLLGRGFITAQNGILYRGDMLFNDLSLVRLCKAFPAIAGYISGRIDGIVSIQGKGAQLPALSGFTELWARETVGEKMLVSKEFLQRLSGKKLSGFFFSSDRPYDHAGITAALEKGFLTFDSLDISHTNMLGIRDLSVTIAPSQNRIAIDHLLNSIKDATVRGKATGGTTGKDGPLVGPPATEFKWDE